MRQPREEPISIDATVVAAFLEGQRCPRMASFVRMLGQIARDASAREDELKRKCNELVSRLHEYEPPEPAGIRDPQWTGD